MKTLKALSLALALSGAAMFAPATLSSAVAQVTNIDVQWAISSIQMAGKRANQVPGIKKVPSVGVIRLDIPTVPMYRGDIPDWQEGLAGIPIIGAPAVSTALITPDGAFHEINRVNQRRLAGDCQAWFGGRDLGMGLGEFEARWAQRVLALRDAL